MKCFLHIGTEKTGTTTLQNWLYDNELPLKKNGIFISKNIGNPNNRLIPAYFMSGIDDWHRSQGISSEKEKHLYFKDFLEKLSAEISDAKKDHHTFIISSEHLHSRLREKKDIKKLHTFLVSVFEEVELICYFRDQFELATSLYSTGLKVNSIKKLEDFIDRTKPKNYYYNYLKIADNWSEIYGKNKCNFRIYDRSALIESDIRLDFLDLVSPNINADNFNMNTTNSNKSLSLIEAAAYRIINQEIPYWNSDQSGRNPDQIIAKKNLSKIDSLKIGKILSNKGDIIRDRFLESNKIFFRKYFKEFDSFPKENEKKLTNTDIPIQQVVKAVEEIFAYGLKLNLYSQKTISEADVKSLKDISLEIYTEDPHLINHVLALLKIALKIYPEDILLKRKVQELSAKVKEKNKDQTKLSVIKDKFSSLNFFKSKD
jgi:hypothetical protein